MHYTETEEYIIKRKHNLYALSLYLTACFLCYRFLDSSYSVVLYTIPIGFVIYFALRCLLQRKTNLNVGYYFNNKSRIIKLMLFTALTGGIFLGIQYGVHWKTISQHFIPNNMIISEIKEYSGGQTQSSDIYWSLKFELDPTTIDDFPQDFTAPPDGIWGCGCGNEYGYWGDTLFNPSKPFTYYENDFGIDGVKIPTWLCMCFSKRSCLGKFGYDSDDKSFNYFYRVVGNPTLAFQNKKCPPESMNFLQIYRQDQGVAAYHSVLYNFLITFSFFAASTAHLITMFYLYFTENFGKRISFVVFASACSVGSEIAILVMQEFYEPMKFYGFLTLFLAGGFLYYPYMDDDLMDIYKDISKGCRKIIRVADPDERIGFCRRFGRRIKNILKFWVIIMRSIFKITVVLWLKGRLKIFTLKQFKMSERRYANLLNSKEVIRKNKFLNILTLFDALVLKSFQGAILTSLVIDEYPKITLGMEVVLGCITYEFLSSIYPILRQMVTMQSAQMMLISLNPRYFNIEVIRKEREMRIDYMNKTDNKDSPVHKERKLDVRREVNMFRS